MKMPEDTRISRYEVAESTGFRLPRANQIPTLRRNLPEVDANHRPKAACEAADDPGASEVACAITSLVSILKPSREYSRNVALIHLLLATGLTPMEVAALRVSDYLNEDGGVRSVSEVRAEISFNGRQRPLLFTNPRVTAAIDAYLRDRVSRGLNVNQKLSYRGLAPNSALVLNDYGRAFEVTNAKTAGRKRECRSLTLVCRQLFPKRDGMKISARDGRRLLAKSLYANGGDVTGITQLMGLSTKGKLWRLMDMQEDSIDPAQRVAQLIPTVV